MNDYHFDDYYKNRTKELLQNISEHKLLNRSDRWITFVGQGCDIVLNRGNAWLTSIQCEMAIHSQFYGTFVAINIVNK